MSVAIVSVDRFSAASSNKFKVFVPRTLAPLSYEYWWSTRNNPCLTRLNQTVLPNCFVGSTQIITNVGVVTLKKACDLSKHELIEVPTIDGEWHKATVKYFGVQKIYKVRLVGSTYYCTGNHRWFISTKKGIKVVTTLQLGTSMKIPYRMCNTSESTRVISVEYTGREEGVYCAVEPITKSFTLSGGEITGNCVGYAYGRFAEINQAFHPDLPICDGGNWIFELQSKKTSLQWGDSPKLGAVGVWRKVSTPGRASPGHVAVVEFINSDGSIMLSESGYGSSWETRFWNSGPWSGPNWYSDDFQFQGFIYNPGTEGVTLTQPFENSIPYGTIISGLQEKYEGPFAYTTSQTALSGSVSSTSGSDSSSYVVTVPNSSSPLYVSTLDTSVDHPARIFVKSIMLHTGSEGHDWVRSTTGIATNQGWSAATCCAAAIDCGFNGKLMPSDVFSILSFASQSVTKYGGVYFEGGFRGGNYKPQTGDIFAISQKSPPYDDRSKFVATHIGVVRELAGDTIKTVEGDVGGKIILTTRRLKDVAWYIRPDWTLVGGTETCESLLDNPLYATSSTKADATLREVSYLNDQCEPSITLSDAKLSAINYTNVLSGIHSVLNQSGVCLEEGVYYTTGQYTVDSSQMQPPSAKVIFDFLVGKGLSAAQAVGFLANIQAESSFSTSAVNASSGASGICQWLGNRRSEMIAFCGSDWRNNLTGQLNYLWFELNSSESATLTKLKNEVKGNDEEAAVQASEVVLRNFERPGHYETQVPLRAKFARALWEQIVVLQNGTGTVSTSGISNRILTKSGKELTAGSTILIPSSIHQSGITTTYTDYTSSYNKWSVSSSQGKIADAWILQHRSSQYYIASVSGYFLVSTTSKFGSVGDILSVVLEDGTYFNCIIADVKSSTNPYGRLLGDGTVSFIEFNTKGDDISSLRAGLVQAGWYDKRISKVVNFGSWIDR